MSLNQALGIEGAGHTATIGDKEYVFMPITKKMQDHFSDWLKNRACLTNVKQSGIKRKEARRLRAEALECEIEDEKRELNSEAFRLEREAANASEDLNAKITAGDYDFGSDISLESMNSLAGLSKITHLSLQIKHKELTLEFVENLVREYYREIVQAIRITNGLTPEVKKEKKEGEENPPAGETSNS